jgi:hypothetical protein
VTKRKVSESGSVAPARPDLPQVIVPSAEAVEYLETSPPTAVDVYGLSRLDRYRLPGWSDLAELDYLSRQPVRVKRGPGRPRGQQVIQTRGEVEATYMTLWRASGRRPTWVQVAEAMKVDIRTLRRARRDFGIEERTITLPPG